MSEGNPNTPWRKDDKDGKKPPDPLLPKEYSQPFKSSERIWQYHDKLRHYLLLIGKDSKAVESLYKFPEAINPPKEWKESFKEMIAATKKTQNEWYSLIATNSQGDILLPKKEFIVEGDKNHVSYEVYMKHHLWAGNRPDVDSIIGSFHTHPTKNNYRSPLRWLFELDSRFSAGDLYHLIAPESALIMGAIQMNHQLVVGFKTKETKTSQILGYLPKGYQDQDSFSDFWYRTQGLKYNPENRTASPVDGKNIRHDVWIDKIWAANMAIAEKHNIALYRGSVGFYLSREFPKPPDIFDTIDKRLK